MLLAFANHINDTSGSSGKFTAGVIDTSGAPQLVNIPRIFVEILNDPTVIFTSWGEDNSF
jgi:hypothetical protein